jgi:type I site-specific restriction endonuclease
MLKIEYISGVLNNEQLQRTNNLYLSLNEVEESLKPLLEEYRVANYRFNDTVGKMVDQFNNCLDKIEDIEAKKVKQIKESVTQYVRTIKADLDQFLEQYPFLCEEIDRMREKEEFVPHSCEALINEFQELDHPLTHTDYIDSIYERIEVKKNLEEIILYGVKMLPFSRTPSTSAV